MSASSTSSLHSVHRFLNSQRATSLSDHESENLILDVFIYLSIYLAFYYAPYWSADLLLSGIYVLWKGAPTEPKKRPAVVFCDVSQTTPSALSMYTARQKKEEKKRRRTPMSLVKPQISPRCFSLFMSMCQHVEHDATLSTGQREGEISHKQGDL